MPIDSQTAAPTSVGNGRVRFDQQKVDVPPGDSSITAERTSYWGVSLYRFDKEVRTDQVGGYAQLEPIVCLNK